MTTSFYQKRKSRSQKRDMALYTKRKERRRLNRLRLVTSIDARETTTVEIKEVKCDYLTEGLE